MNDIPLYGHTTLGLSTHPSMTFCALEPGCELPNTGSSPRGHPAHVCPLAPPHLLDPSPALLYPGLSQQREMLGRDPSCALGPVGNRCWGL